MWIGNMNTNVNAGMARYQFTFLFPVSHLVYGVQPPFHSVMLAQVTALEPPLNSK